MTGKKKLTKGTIEKIVIVVESIDEKVAAYDGLFDIPVVEVITTNPPTSPAVNLYHGKSIPGKVKLANIHMGDITLELIEPIDSDSPWGDFLKEKGEGVFSIVWTVDDLHNEKKIFEADNKPMYHIGEYEGGRYSYFDTLTTMGITVCLQSFDN